MKNKILFILAEVVIIAFVAWYINWVVSTGREELKKDYAMNNIFRVLDDIPKGTFIIQRHQYNSQAFLIVRLEDAINIRATHGKNGNEVTLQSIDPNKPLVYRFRDGEYDFHGQKNY